MRKAIPNSKEKKVLVMNKHCCCICQAERMYKPVAIHHIDGNNSNNKLENLAVLCLDHHSMADAGLKKGKVGSGKKLTPTHVKEYKKLWEAKVNLTSKVEKRKFPLYQKKQLQILYQFEINKIKNEILVLGNSDKRLVEKFDYLDKLYFEELTGEIKLRRFLLEAYHDLVVPGWIFEDRKKTKLLAEAVPELFSHLGNPDWVPMDRFDKQLLIKALDVLETLASFAGEFDPYISPLKNACNAILELAEISSPYRPKGLKQKFMKVLNEVKKNCSEYDSEKVSKQASQQRQRRVAIVKKTLEEVKAMKW